MASLRPYRRNDAREALAALRREMHADHPLRGLDHAADVLESRLDGSMPKGAVSLEGAARTLLVEARAVVDGLRAAGSEEENHGD